MEDNVRVINRAFDLLELLARSNHPMSLTEIVSEGNISKTTAYRLLHTMHERHYVEKDKNNCYTIGIQLIETVSSHINGLELQTESKPILATLREDLNLTAHLGILDGTDVIYVEKLDLYPTTRLYTQIGYRSPAYCSSMGKCMLSCLSGDELDEILYHLKFEAFTPNTISSAKELKQHLKKVRMQGYAIDNQEYMTGHRCIGAPVFDYRGDVIASISASGPISQVTDEKVPFVVNEVKRAAAEISKRMGYTI